MRGVLTLKSVYSVDVDDLGNHLWSGAKDRWDSATDEQRERAFSLIEDIFWDEEEIDDGKVNDFIWFDCDDIFFEEESEDESEDEDDVTDEDEEESEDESDEDDEKERFAIVYGEGEIQYGEGKDSGLFIVGHNKYNKVMDAALDMVLCGDYEEVDSYGTLEAAQEALKDKVSRIYELKNYIGKPYVFARMFLLIHYHDNGYDIEGASPVQNELMKDCDNE